MEIIARGLLVVAFGAGTLLDFFLIILGIAIILRAESILSYLISIALAFALVCIRLCMDTVIRRDGILYLSLKAAFVVSVLVSLAATVNALALHVLLKKPLWTSFDVEWAGIATSENLQLKVILTVIALFLGASPLVVSHLAREYADEMEDDADENMQKQNARTGPTNRPPVYPHK